jgi:hypothetical protein
MNSNGNGKNKMLFQHILKEKKQIAVQKFNIRGEIGTGDLLNINKERRRLVGFQLYITKCL